MNNNKPMKLDPNQKYRWPVREQVRYLNRCLYPQLKEIDEKMNKIISMNKFTEFAIESVRKDLYKKNNIPLHVI